ncbi:MAG: protein kinase domain-containing protein [Gemmatimonadales bacterium]
MADVLRMLQEGLAGRYTVERELGHGGMAAVFLARDLRHDRLVALKVLYPDLSASIGTERFTREIRFAARLQHPHILSVHDSGEVPGTAGRPTLLWFSMPFVDGESLRERLTRDRQLPPSEAIRIAREVADALAYAHGQGLIHRDIKPENILLSGGHALVADFGVARALGRGGDDSPALTGTGLAVGTPAYMSPEQATGEQSVDNRSDLYSLGSVLYEMLAGEPPFHGPTAQAILTRMLTEAPRPLGAVRQGLPPLVERIVSRAIARAPADRYPSAAELAGDLEIAGSQITTPGSGTLTVPVPRKRRPVPLFAMLSLGFLLGLGALFAWTRSHRDAGDGPVLLAVLPFENIGDSADAYFAEGMTDEVRGKLSSIPDFQVIARASSSQYRGSAKPLKEIAKELGVSYLLTGTVRWVKTGTQSRVQVRPELVEVVRSGATVGRWERPFDAALDDVFKVQADIAGQVAVALRGELASSAMPGAGDAPTSNIAAYDEFLRGEQIYFGSSGSVSLLEAARRYEAAVTLDSAFARAWSRLGMVRASLYIASTPSLENSEAARSAAETALRLDPRLPEAHLAQGNYYSLVRADFPRAIEVYTKGLAIAPAHAELLGALGLAEQGLGKVDDALAHMRRGLALDPRSLLYTRRLIRLLTYTRRYDESAELITRARTIAPNDPGVALYDAWLHLSRGDLAGARAVTRRIPKEGSDLVISFLGFDLSGVLLLDDEQRQRLLRLRPSHFGGNRGGWGVTMAQGWYAVGDSARVRAYADSALPSLQRAVQENPGEPNNHISLGTALALAGRKAEAIREGERAVALRADDGFQGVGFRHQLARIYQVAGEPVKAIEQYEALLRVPYYVGPGWLRADPSIESLRGHPRFRQLLARADSQAR